MSNPFRTNNQPMGQPMPPMQVPAPFNNMQAMMQQFQQFRKNFRGNPQQIVQQMLQTGQITQEQFNQAQAMAQQFSQFFG